jgi:hypothetical protein
VARCISSLDKTCSRRSSAASARSRRVTVDMTTLTRKERDDLLVQMTTIDRRLYPDDQTETPHGRVAATLRETYYQLLAAYADRLPRIVMSACPFTGQTLERAFDPFGLDGPWWYQDREVEIAEPEAPATFKVLLGALALRGRTPTEARADVIPGPEVPFVVPRLLRLPGMVCVVSQLTLTTGDTAYPIAYFSPEEIAPKQLHQPWLRQELWFKADESANAWLIANDAWDFDLEPWVASGKLRWIEPTDAEARVVDGRAGRACPYVDLPGDRAPQLISSGDRELLELPDGTPINPFED